MAPSTGFLKRWKSQDKERAQFSLSLLTPFIKDVHREKSLCSCSSFVSSNICHKQCFTEKEKKRMSPGTRGLRPWATSAISQQDALDRSG